jgi:hypothetical protein
MQVPSSGSEDSHCEGAGATKGGREKVYKGLLTPDAPPSPPYATPTALQAPSSPTPTPIPTPAPTRPPVRNPTSPPSSHTKPLPFTPTLASPPADILPPSPTSLRKQSGSAPRLPYASTSPKLGNTSPRLSQASTSPKLPRTNPSPKLGGSIKKKTSLLRLGSDVLKGVSSIGGVGI